MIPAFYGDENDIEAWGWLLGLEQHFQANQVPEDERLKEAVKGLRGQALCWYIIWSGLNSQVSWRSFDRAFIGKYIPEICLVEKDDVSNSPGKKKGNEKERNNAKKGTEIYEAETVEKDDATYPKTEGIVAIEVEENREDRSAKTEEEEGGNEDEISEGEDEEISNKGGTLIAEKEDETEVEEEEGEEDQGRGEEVEVEADVRENLEMIYAPLRHKNYEVMPATFLNGRREETCAETCLRAVADFGRKKMGVQVVEEREVVTRRWGSGMGWSWSEKLESRFGLGGNNRVGLTPNTHWPNISVIQKSDDGGVGLGTQNGSHSVQ